MSRAPHIVRLVLEDDADLPNVMLTVAFAKDHIPVVGDTLLLWVPELSSAACWTVEAREWHILDGGAPYTNKVGSCAMLRCRLTGLHVKSDEDTKP